LLTGLIYLNWPNGKRQRLIGSTSNIHRTNGGTAYYCISSSNINIPCHKIDNRIPALLQGIQVDPELLPMIRKCYIEEIAQKLGHQETDQKAKIEHTLKAIDREEERILRLYAMGKISDEIYDNL
jgi:hypothetical protein